MPVPINDESTPLLPSNAAIDDQEDSEKLAVDWLPALSLNLLEVKAKNDISAQEPVAEQPQLESSRDLEAQRDRLSYGAWFRPPPVEEIDINSYLYRKRLPFPGFILVSLVVILLVHSVIGFLSEAQHHALFCPNDLNNYFWGIEFIVLFFWSKPLCEMLFGLRMWEKGAREWLEMEQPQGWQKLVERYGRGGDFWLLCGFTFTSWFIIVQNVHLVYMRTRCD